MSAATATLITCHANADFDAFAAMLAARHLYAPCMLLFPGSQERGLQKVYANLNPAAYGFAEAADLRWEDFDRLVLVDTRQRSRVGHVAPLLERPGIRIEAWDHHPDSPDDIAADAVHLAQVGAVTSLLVQNLETQNVRLGSDEATLLGLGIYGDTGSFTYSSTTAEDFQAAAWLLGQGMDVNQINEMAAHELTSLHIQALNSLLESAHTYTINNTPVVLAEASMEHYLGDFAYLAHRLMEMEKFSVLFAIGIMGDRIQVVARSRSDAVNVGDICAELGGGGHAYAASASVRSMTINEVRETILRRLYDQANPDKTAREYMSAPAVGIESASSIQEADELMLHFGLKAVPVFRPGTRSCVGLLDAQTASRASAHGLGDSPVEDYMQRRVRTLPPDASLKELTAVIVDARQRLVPIVEGEKVAGVVTRTDLINVFADEPGRLLDRKSQNSKERNIGKLIQDRLPAEIRELLHLAGQLGRKLGLPVYAVGGFVRDLLLDRPNQDIDLVVEGNGIALAVRLDSTPFGQLVDFFGGQRDIKERVIRVLHTLSFVEDPTRGLRAVRVEQRYKFRIGPGAEKLIKNALSLKLMDRLSGARLFNEYQHICDEEDPPACFSRLDELGILQAIAPQLGLTPNRRNLLHRLKEMLTWYRLLYFDETAQAWLVYFLGLNLNMNYADTSAHYLRLGLPQVKKAEILGQREQMRAVRGKLEAWQRQDDMGTAKVSALCALLRPIALECLLYIMASTDNPGLQKNLSRYITQWRRERADIGGAELRRLGLAPGPLYGRILKAVLVAKLDGEAPNVESQLNLARRLAQNASENNNKRP